MTFEPSKLSPWQIKMTTTLIAAASAGKRSLWKPPPAYVSSAAKNSARALLLCWNTALWSTDFNCLSLFIAKVGVV